MSAHAHEKKLLRMPLLAQQRLTRRLVTCRSCSRFKVYHTLDEPEHAHLKCVCCLQSSSCRVRREARCVVVTHNNSTAVDSLTYFYVHCESLSRDSKGPFSCASLWRGLHFAVQTHFSQRSHTRAVCVRLADHSPLRGGPASGGWPKNQVKSPFGVSKPEKFSGLAGADGYRAPS